MAGIPAVRDDPCAGVNGSADEPVAGWRRGLFTLPQTHRQPVWFKPSHSASAVSGALKSASMPREGRVGAFGSLCLIDRHKQPQDNGLSGMPRTRLVLQQRCALAR